MSAELLEVELSQIETNPFRLKTYPFNERKIETLRESIETVGLWQGVIARRKGNNRFELAFGHHRVEAARRNKLKTASLIVRSDLTDERMLQFMGRENSEDYNSNFLVMLGTWEAGVNFRLPETPGKQRQVIDIARLLGWTRIRSAGGEDLNDTASACNAALALIKAGHLSHDDLRNLSTDAARLICERAQSRIEMIDKLGKQGKRQAKEIEKDKQHVGRAARSVAKDVREDNIPRKEIRREIDQRAAKSAGAKGRQTPLFAAFAKGVAEHIHTMLISDKTAERLAEMQGALPHVSMEEDFASLRRVDFALAEHEQTTGKWREKLTPQGKKVVPFKLLKGDK